MILQESNWVLVHQHLYSLIVCLIYASMKWNKTLGYACTVLMIIVASSCSPSLKVTSDYDKSTSFEQYKTFTIDTARISESFSQLNQNRLINAVKTEMIKKGFTQSTSPDILVHVSAIFQEQKSVNSTTDYYGYGGVYRPYKWGGGVGATGYTTYNVQNYIDGSLIIDVADAKTRSLLWEGIGNKEINKPAKDPDKAITEAVSKILANFPPGATSKK
jgi:hypothetical protein